jgi:N-acetylmuramoyl-L-alanine amidase
LEGPWIVAVQPGHWKVEELPQEQAHRRTSTGAYHGSVREVDINRAVAKALIERIEEAGWSALLVPATVPPGLRADVFLSIHADGGDGTERGWKLSPPWRPSAASLRLAAAVRRSFSAESILTEDEDGITIGMRGYYGFSYRRYHHAISPFTPAVLVELGFVSHPTDRRLMTSRPDFFADLIMRGLRNYFDGRERTTVDDLLPMELPRYVTASDGAAVRIQPHAGSTRLMILEGGSFLIPVDERGDWYEVFIRRYRRTGWIMKADLMAVAPERSPFSN